MTVTIPSNPTTFSAVNASPVWSPTVTFAIPPGPWTSAYFLCTGTLTCPGIVGVGGGAPFDINANFFAQLLTTSYGSTQVNTTQAFASMPPPSFLQLPIAAPQPVVIPAPGLATINANQGSNMSVTLLSDIVVNGINQPINAVMSLFTLTLSNGMSDSLIIPKLQIYPSQAMKVL